jgi:hypothetical protein
MADPSRPRTLGDAAARQLANTTKTPPQWIGTTPRWLVQLLPWTPIEAGVYRVNRVIDDALPGQCSPDDDEDRAIDEIRYEEKPREYVLSACTKTVEVHTRISDLFRSPMDQVKEQLTIAVERLKERQEDELINNGAYGLLNNVHDSMRVRPRGGAPTPDDLDELLIRVWKEPAFFLAHPRAIAAFGRECTRRGIYPDTVPVGDSAVPGWRGVPIFPCGKIPVSDTHTTSIIAMRTGENDQGVVGLHQVGIPDEYEPGLNVRFMGISQRAIISYLVSAYFSVAVLVPDALGILENVEISRPRG